MADRDTLPKAIKPSHYALSLRDLELGGKWTYQGTVDINVNVIESTKNVLLNTKQIKIHEATISAKGSDALKSNNVTYDEKAQRANIKFQSALPQGDAVLSINFEGVMNNQMCGFYRSKYKPTVPATASVPRDDEYHYMFSTQFEACDARTAFPCFDEPNLKASFDFDIEIPEDQTALSNMPEQETKPGSKSGLKIVKFEKAPAMSTYLYAWAFGDFEYVEDFTSRKYNGKNLPVRVYTTRGLKDQGRFALKNAHQVIDLFSEVFDIDYPLPKSDLLAVHEFTHGAMENWGLVTYRTTAVLFDEENSDQRYRNRVAYVVAHELAHQWFGNLVTMDWWNELWLNEGFATWVGWYAIDKLYPEWEVWSQFCSEGMQTAFTLDSIRSSHPIEVPVKDALEVDQIFDSISYLKGSSAIRMLSNHLGVEVFLKGVSDYLKAHKYGNATTNDLWTALSKASGQDVTAFMDPWIRKIGFPVVTVAEEPGQIGLRQSRFLTTGDVKAEDDQTLWWIPTQISSGNPPTVKSPALATKEETIRDVDTGFYKINSGQTGFYRTNYPPPRLVKLGEAKDSLPVEDRIGIIGDASALAVSGNSTTAGLLGLIENFQSEKNYLVWSQIISSLGTVRSVFSGDEQISKALRKFTLQLVTPATDRLGWEFKPHEDYLTSQLRALLISTAGMAGHEGVIKEAKRQFELYMSGKDKKAINQNLRAAVWRIAVTEGSRGEYEAVQKEFLTTTSVDGREIALQSMGRVQSPELAKDYFEFLFSDKVAGQDVHSGSIALAANSKTRLTLWECIKGNWDTVTGKLVNPVVLDRFVRVSLNKFSDRKVGEDIWKFFEGKDNKGYDRSLSVVADTINANASYKERDREIVKEWLEAHGYMA